MLNQVERDRTQFHSIGWYSKENEIKIVETEMLNEVKFINEINNEVVSTVQFGIRVRVFNRIREFRSKQIGRYLIKWTSIQI